jgi:hypothetical protein
MRLTAGFITAQHSTSLQANHNIKPQGSSCHAGPAVDPQWMLTVHLPALGVDWCKTTQVGCKPQPPDHFRHCDSFWPSTPCIPAHVRQPKHNCKPAVQATLGDRDTPTSSGCWPVYARTIFAFPSPFRDHERGPDAATAAAKLAPSMSAQGSLPAHGALLLIWLQGLDFATPIYAYVMACMGSGCLNCWVLAGRRWIRTAECLLMRGCLQAKHVQR